MQMTRQCILCAIFSLALTCTSYAADKKFTASPDKDLARKFDELSLQVKRNTEEAAILRRDEINYRVENELLKKAYESSIQKTNPLYYVLIVNIFTLVWAVRSWKKSVREKWMNNLRDLGVELIGAAELVYGMNAAEGTKLADVQASFIAKEQKLLLLFAHNDAEKKIFQNNSEKLRSAAERRESTEYRCELNNFSNSLSARILKEWQEIKGIL